MEFLQTPIEYLKGVGPNRANILKQELKNFLLSGSITFSKSLYERILNFTKSMNYQNNSEVQLKGKIISIRTLTQKNGKRLIAIFSDGKEQMELIWFRGHQWIEKSLKLDISYVIFGRLNWYNNKPSIPHPEMETEDNFKKGFSKSLQAVYPSSEKLIAKGISQRITSKMISELLNSIKTPFFETLPHSIISKYKFLDKNESLINIHFPKSQEKLTIALNRLKYEELFFMQLQLLIKNLQHKEKIKGYTLK